MPQNLPVRISDEELFLRVKKNLRYLRKEVFYKKGLSTLSIAKAIGSTSDKLKRIEDDLKGTINSFLLLLNFYERVGIDLNAVFTKDLQTGENGGVLRINSLELPQTVLMPIAADTTEVFYKNAAYLRKGMLKGTGVTTKKMEESTGVGTEKILRMEKGGKGRITTVVSIIYYYIRKGIQINTLITHDLSVE